MPIEIPELLPSYLDEILGPHSRSFQDGLRFDRKTSFRINTLKSPNPTWLTDLRQQGFGLRELPFFKEAFQVSTEPTPVSKTLEHFLGLFYIQSVASMIPALIMDPQPGELILDLAAAPGSKTTQLAQMMGNRGCLVANEWDGQRVKTLSHNLDRMGVLSAALVNMGGERIGNLLPETFDRALVDAPCSAVGVIHKAPQAIDNLRYVKKFSFIQEQLLVSALKALKIGGTLVYSTCTVTPEENEMLIDTMVKRYGLEVEDIVLHPSISTISGLRQFGHGEWLAENVSRTVRVFPNDINSEGFFVARLRKTGPVAVPGDRQPLGNVRFDLVDSNDPEIQRMVVYFESVFGIDPRLWDAFAFMKKADEFLITSRDWIGRESILNRLRTHRVGMRVARTRRAGEWKLSTNAAQLFSPHVVKNRILLEDTQDIESFVSAGTIRRDFGVEKGGVVVFGRGHALGCGVVHQSALKSQMPKSRTVIGVDIF